MASSKAAIALMVIPVLTVSIAAALGQPRNVPQSKSCLESLQGTSTLDRKGRVRFELSRFDDTPSMIVGVDPADLREDSRLCEAKRLENGALFSDVFLNLQSSKLFGPKAVEQRHIMAGFTAMGQGVFEDMRKLNFVDTSLPTDRRHGLKYHPAFGSFYWGNSPGRKEIQISCLEGDRPTGTCMASIQARKNVVIWFEMRRNELEHWQRYARGLERYFNEHTER